jgi:hypothetical protein
LLLILLRWIVPLSGVEMKSSVRVTAKPECLSSAGNRRTRKKAVQKKAGETKGDQKNGITIAARMILFTPLLLKRVF